MLFKDLLLAKQAAESTSAKTPLGTRVTELFDEFIKAGHGHEDFSAIIRHLR